MPDARGSLDVESSLKRIEALLADLDGRVRALEQRAVAEPGSVTPAGAAATAEAAAAGMASSAPAERPDLTMVLSLIGRTFVVFGGAFLLRALTDSGRLAGGAGVALGLTYALAWLAAADRAASRGRRASSAFHGTTAVLIALPLLWEASTRFGLLAPRAAAAVLAAFTGVALFVSWRQHLQSLAAVASLGALALALALVGATAHVGPFAVLAILVGVATLWLGYDRDWFWLRWPAAIVADLTVLGLVSRATGAERLESWHAGVAIPLFLLFAYLASFATRTLVRGRVVIPFEVAQTVAALAIGLGGALAVAHVQGGGETALGAAAVALGAGCYAVAFAFVERRHGLGANFFFYSTLALVLTLVGGGILLPRASFATVAAVLAVLSTWLALRRSRLALAAHGAIYAWVAAASSGLLAWAGTAFVSGAFVQTPLAWPAWIALAASLACLAMQRPSQEGVPGAFASGPRLATALVLVIGLGALLVTGLASLTAGTPADTGILATDRTAVIAVSALGLAIAARYEPLREFGWLLYPVLLVGAVKLLVEDFQRSRPATLFIALALYGVALIAAPRLVRRPAGAVPVDRRAATR